MRRGAFTLIELLIVVAIIAILAAIAVPNFLEAQTRSKVSRAKADLRTLATALESYVVDYNKYPDINRGNTPPTSFPIKAGPDYALLTMPRLSTPVAYISTALLGDPFDRTRMGFMGYANARASEEVDLLPIGAGPSTFVYLPAYREHGYILICIGPDSYDYTRNLGNDPAQGPQHALEFFGRESSGVGLNMLYDPTNGTISVGEILRTRDIR